MIRITTHDGGFHADDIGAVATLFLYLDEEEVEVVRTRDNAIIDESDYVVDVGGVYSAKDNRFDHHQEGFTEKRENGIPYAAFGLVWREYGKDICDSEEVANRIDQRLVQPIDAIDNGILLTESVQDDVFPYGLYGAIAAFRPTWKEDTETGLNAFLHLVSAAKHLINREIKVTADYLEGEERVKDIYKETDDTSVIILDKKYPWKGILAAYPEPLLAVYPNSTNTLWRVEAVPKQPNDMLRRRIYLPESWAGKRDELLQEVSGVSDAIFCHPGRFTAGAKSKTGALSLAKRTLSRQ